jgi:fructose/tagatose bisphosphate aldolase
MAEQFGVTTFVHLDHCRDEEVLWRSIEAGFDGVMADGSHLSLEENIAWTGDWRRQTRERGVVLEAEFSPIKGEEDGIVEGSQSLGLLSLPEYDRFCASTEPDICGADIGTHHGHYDRPPVLDLELISSLCGSARPPFVVHGGSGLPNATLRELARAGVAKLNISTDLKDSWLRAVRAAGAEREPLALLRLIAEEVSAMAEHKWSNSHIKSES